MKSINNLIRIAILITFFSALSQKSIKCTNVKSKVCNVARFTSYPGKYFLSGYENTRRFINNFRRTGKFTTTNQLAKTAENKNRKNKNRKNKNRFDELEPGFSFFYKPHTRPNAGYLLLSRTEHKGKNFGRAAVEIWDMNKQELIHKYKFDIKDLKDKLGVKNSLGGFFRHPLILDDGSLVFVKNYSLIKTDKCGNLIAFNDEILFHHSIDISENGKLYVPIRYRLDSEYKGNMGIYNQFNPSGFAILNKDLKVLSKFSLIDIYKKGNLLVDIYGKGQKDQDPFHLNDVLPLKNPKGNDIVILSLRNQSSVLAFDLDSEKIIWKIERAFSQQHDVDLVSYKEGLIDISIFDNNVYRYPNRKASTEVNKIVYFKGLNVYPSEHIEFISGIPDFTKYEMNVISFEWMPKEMRPKTLSQGLSEFIKENNSLMIEEQNYGRIFEYEIDSKKMLWEYINKESKKSNPLYVGWSRRMLELPGNLNEKSFNSCYGL